MLVKDTAICIRCVDYSETSQVVTLFTRDSGQVSAIAKGSKRPKSAFGGPLEILAYGRVVFTAPAGEKLATLTEFQQEPPDGVMKNLLAINCGLYAAELISKMTKPCDPHPSLFDIFLAFLRHIQGSADELEIRRLLIFFQLALLAETGLKPHMDSCVSCRLPMAGGHHDTYFSSSANGLICRSCSSNFADRTAVGAGCARCLTDLRQVGDAGPAVLGEIQKLVVAHLSNLLGHRPKMAKYV